MYYWILRSPPGYDGDRSLMVNTYRTPNPESHLPRTPQVFAGSLEEARSKVPAPCERIEHEPFHQFLELWRSVD